MSIISRQNFGMSRLSRPRVAISRLSRPSKSGQGCGTSTRKDSEPKSLSHLFCVNSRMQVKSFALKKLLVVPETKSKPNPGIKNRSRVQFA